VTILRYDPVCGRSEPATLNLLAEPDSDSTELAAGLEDDIRDALEE